MLLQSFILQHRSLPHLAARIQYFFFYCSQGTVTEYHRLRKRIRPRRPTLATPDKPYLDTARKSVISPLPGTLGTPPLEKPHTLKNDLSGVSKDVNTSAATTSTDAADQEEEGQISKLAGLNLLTSHDESNHILDYSADKTASTRTRKASRQVSYNTCWQNLFGDVL